MICVECGSEVEDLKKGLCKSCYMEKKVRIDIEDPIEIDFCPKCGGVRKGEEWIQRPDFETLMLDRIENALSISSDVDRSSFRAEFDDSDPNNIGVNLDVKLISDDIEKEKELSTNIVLKKKQCKNCSKREGDYYEAILQVRPTEEDMSKEQKAIVEKIVHDKVEVEKGEEQKVFITFEKEIHGGLDFYLSDKRVTKNLSYQLADRFGADVKSSSELAGREDGQNVYRMTYSVRLPPYEKNDFIEVEDKIYRIKNTRRGSGPIRVFDLEENRITTLDKEKVNEAEVHGGEELIEEAVVVSEKEGEFQIMDPETFETKTLLKPEGFSEGVDQVKVVRIRQKLHLLPEGSD